MTGVFRRAHFPPYYQPRRFIPSAPAGAGNQTISLAAIEPFDVAGAPSLVPGAVTLSAAPIGSEESFGIASVSPVTLIVLARLPGEEAHGAGVLGSSYSLAAQAIGSQESPGQTTVLPGAISIALAGVLSAEIIGDSIVSVGGQTLTPGSLPSELAIGVLTLLPGAVTLIPAALPSAETLGTPGVSPSNIVIIEGGVPADEKLGQTLLIQGPAVVSVASLQSAESVGHIAIVGGAQTVGRLIAEIKLYAALNGTLDLRGPDATTHIN